jgi:hypothetical protein
MAVISFWLLMPVILSELAPVLRGRVEIRPTFIVQADAAHDVIIHGGCAWNRELLGDLAGQPGVIGLAHQMIVRRFHFLCVGRSLPRGNKASTDRKCFRWGRIIVRTRNEQQVSRLARRGGLARDDSNNDDTLAFSRR